MSKLVDIIKNNPKYAMSEAVGFVSAYGSATLAMYALSQTDASPGTKTVITFAAKDLGFIAGKLLSHQSDQIHLLKSMGWTGVVKGGLQLLLHYAFLKNKWVPEYLAPFVAYSIPGFLMTGIRYRNDYNTKVIRTKPDV